MTDGNGVQRELGALDARLSNVEKVVEKMDGNLDRLISAHSAAEGARNLRTGLIASVWGLVVAGAGIAVEHLWPK